MARVLSVGERQMRAFVDALKQIRQANGFNTDVQHVRRVNQMADYADDPPEIHLVPGTRPTIQDSTQLRLSRRALRIVFFKRADVLEPDTEYELFVADIVRVLCGTIADSSGQGGPRELFIETNLDDTPKIWEGAPQSISGFVDCTLKYTWSLRDPRLYDDTDVLVLEE